jgi:hypothetical protein
VDLVTEVGSDRSHKEVESYEAEGALVLLTILADIEALHDPHVGVIDEAVTRRRWRTDTAATAPAQDCALTRQVVDGDQPPEVANRRRLVARDVVVNVQQLASTSKLPPAIGLGLAPPAF